MSRCVALYGRTVTAEASLYFNKDGDPRRRFPDLTAILPEENFLLWQTQGRCLCGCGGKPRPRDDRRQFEIAYFCLGHASVLRRRHGMTKQTYGSTKTHEQRLAQRRENMSRTIDGRVILELVREHIDVHHGGSIVAFCRTIGMDHSSLCHNFRKNPRMLRSRAKLLLEAIGERPHRSLG